MKCFKCEDLGLCPVPIQDLYIDPYGELASRTLDAARRVYGRRRFDARYGELSDKLGSWLCDHCDYGDYKICAECISDEPGGIEATPFSNSQAIEKEITAIMPSTTYNGESKVVPDKCSVSIPALGYGGAEALNRLTAHNKSKLKKRSRVCGCFRCGSRFRADEVDRFLIEEHGEDTALCPYCGEDAVIIGTAKFPLSTALLSLLYMHWYPAEYKERKKHALIIPDHTNESSYLRKGVPFLMRGEDVVSFVDEITLLPAEIAYYEHGFIGYPGYLVDSVSKIEDREDWVIVKVAPFTDVDGFRRVVFIDGSGVHLPFEPKTPEELQRLFADIDRYGDALRGVVKDWRTRTMKLYVEKARK